MQTYREIKMLCHITRPDSMVMEVDVDSKANGEDCLHKVPLQLLSFKSILFHVVSICVLGLQINAVLIILVSVNILRI